MRLRSQLRLLMRHYDLSAAQLSRKCGIKPSTLAEWLKGRSPRNLDQVKQLADCMNMTVDELVWGDGLSSTPAKVTLNDLLGDEWLSGVIEIKVRKARK